MPAITVDDITTLEKLPELAPGTAHRRVRGVTTAPSGLEGEGFPVIDGYDPSVYDDLIRRARPR